MLEKVYERVELPFPDNKIEIFTDGNTKCFSKKMRRLKAHLHIFQFYWNFINEFKSGYSPAMIEGLTDHIWNWKQFLMFHFAV